MKLTEIQNQIYNSLKEYEFKSFITLTYPPEIYPNNEKGIKEHLKSFTEKLRDQKRKTHTIYLYVYELQQTKRIHIHLLTNIEHDSQLLKLKNNWLKIIGTDKIQALNFKKVEAEDLTAYCSYILKILNKNKSIERSEILEKLGINSRLVGGSLEFQKLLKELKESIIPITFESPINTKTLSGIQKGLKNKYTNIPEETLEEEILLELQNYMEAYSLIQYTDISEFLKQGKSKVSKGYLQFYNFIQAITNEILYDFKLITKTWYNKKERKGIKTKILQTALDLEKDIPHEEYRILINAVLDFILKSSIRGLNLSIISIQLGKIIISEEVIKKLIKNNIITDPISDKQYREIGIVIFLIIKEVLLKKLKFNLNITDIEDSKIESSEMYLESMIEEDEDLHNILQQKQTISFMYTTENLLNLKEKKKLTKELITDYLMITHPMITPPKDWDVSNMKSIDTIENKIEIYDASMITNGGYLLNDLYFKKSLQKNINKGHLHKLAVSKSCINTINKVQKIAFVVNTDLLNLLTLYKKEIPDYKTKDELSKVINLKKEKIKLRQELFKEKRNFLTKHINIGPTNDLLESANIIVEKCNLALTKHENLNRLLTNFNNLNKQSKFYYSYDVDFRMRLYPQQTELSPQGSKLSRSLIKFKEEFEFNLKEFMLYSTRLYKKIYEFDETQLIIIFKTKIEPLLKEFIINEKQSIKKIFEEASEPYLFLAAALEYKKYKAAERKGEKYKTGYPIILDCSGSGPQILSLLFLMDDFSTFLNLEPNNARKDFYIAVISKFLEESDFYNKYIKEDVIENKRQELFILLRSICKNVIMTQVYGVSYLKVNKDLNRGFKEKEEKISQYLRTNVKYIDFINEFIKNFWDYLRKLPLFKLRSFFQIIINNLSKTDKELSWTILSNAKVSVNYQKHVIKTLDFKENILGRVQFNHKEMLGKKNFSKMKTSAQANFIHSIDAAINMYILEKHKSSIFPIHDAWGIGMGQSEELLGSVKEIYHKLAIDNIMLKTIIEEFISLLSKTVSEEAGNLFKEYCDSKLELGNYDPNLILLCKYMIYYG